LFEEARIGQNIYFSRNGTNFELQLDPTIQYKQIAPLESPGGLAIKTTTVPFDDYAKNIATSVFRKEFRTFQDVPDNRPVIYLYDLHKFGPREEATICISGTFYSFSLDTKRIYLNQTGVHPLNPATLKLFEFELTSEIAGTALAGFHKDSESLTVQVSSSGCSNSDIEILLDQNELYVMMNKTKFLKNPSETQLFFYHKNLCEILRTKEPNIDTSRIAAINYDCGILEIRFPFIKNNTAEAIVNKNTPPSEKMIHFSVTCDVGFGNMFGVCCHPLWGQAPLSFAWSKGNTWKGEIPIGTAFKCVKICQGKVTAWEQGGDRIFNEDFYNDLQGSTVALTSEDVKFS
jgi:HSP20 family molecular chaperone IbpA